jgi:hypothetical protein
VSLTITLSSTQFAALCRRALEADRPVSAQVRAELKQEKNRHEPG